MLDLAPHNPYGLRLRTPVLTAAGCFGYGVEYARLVDLGQIGAIVTRSTSLRGRRTTAPQLVETPAGLLWGGAWPDPGLAHVLDHYAPIWAGWRTPVLLSVVGADLDEYVAIARMLEGAEGIAGVELNLAAQAAQAARITAAVRAATPLPILAKLPAGPELARLAHAVGQAGADALTLVAPPPAAAPDPQGGRLLHGWLAGPAIRPLVLGVIAELAAAIERPIIGVGGVMEAADAGAMLRLGASAVQVGSALLINPRAAAQIGGVLSDGVG